MGNDIREAGAAARKRLSQTPQAVAVAYAEPYRRLLIELSTGAGLLVDPREIEGLERATPEDLAQGEISPSGFGIHFPSLDADVYLPALLEGKFGSRAFMAAHLGKAGGSVRTAFKAKASRANGKLGGRPKKQRVA